MLLHGGCHCGNIAFELDWEGDADAIPARACECTFCTKHGGVWTSHPQSRLRVTVRDPARVSTYAFGTRTATFHVCAACGAVPFVTSDIEGRAYAVINVNTLEGVHPSQLRRSPATFEGESVDARLARRRRNWIADVHVVSLAGDSAQGD
ncbi:MAG TPA: hypothetical protein VIH36_08935 [Casimicrobiaceae bacterium]|jgi:hypothetical protein